MVHNLENSLKYHKVSIIISLADGFMVRIMT